MQSKRFKPERYQVNKEALQICKSGHPWIFRSHVSSAIEVFPSGQVLRLVDGGNKTWGFGLYDPDGLIAIRVLREGTSEPDTTWMKKKLDKAVERRKNLRGYAGAFRALNGESDGFPGVVLDIYGDTGVLQTYSKSVDTIGRYCAANLTQQLKLKNLIWKLPTKRQSTEEKKGTRVLRGHLPGAIKFLEGKMEFTVEIGEGQKSGAFLDLRALRKWVALEKLNGKKVLNLFSYTGTLALAAETAGASEIWSVDISKGALETAKKFHALNPKKHRYIVADVFDWIKQLKPSEQFDLIIVDPPQMTSKSVQVPMALKAYRQIYSEVAKHLAPHGKIVGACCTSRISRREFQETTGRTLGPVFKLIKSLAPEDDHPATFPEADYLKILIFER